MLEATSLGSMDVVDDDEATTLMLEALFDIKAAVFESHAAIFGEDDDEEEVDGDDA